MEPKRPVIVVTGATGQQGSAVIRHLPRHFHVRAVTRDVSKPAARALAAQDVEVVSADLLDRASLERAFAGATALFGVTNFWDGMASGKPLGADGEVRQGKNLVDAAKAAGVKHVVFSSAGQSFAWPSPVPHARSKQEVERYLLDSKLPATVLRPAFFMENYNSPMMDFGAKAREGRIELPIRAHQRLQMVSTEDIGAFAALAFGRPQDFVGAAFDLAGDALTPGEVAAVFSKVLGKPVASVADERAIPAIKQYSQEFGLMWEAFDSLGGDAFIPGLRALHPALESLETFLRRTGWGR
ncbi:MAG: NmrA/HSCARG family protein [Myxococcaceae bacterium]|nr:NmrA/HSCARG family protein [Myxococcaceae bacterium]